MKKLGLIGGTGPESTIEYYRQIEYAVLEKAGAFPPLAIESKSVFDVLGFCDRGDYEGLAAYLVEGFTNLAAAGADFAALTGITPHVVFDEISKASPIPVVSMVETACEETKKRGFTRIALLGTYPTMTGAFFQKPFTRAGISVVTPAEGEMKYIGEKIETELERGRVVPETRQELVRIAERLVHDEGAQAIVLGCTELPMILNDSLLSVPTLDVMKIHVAALVERILGKH